jgi:hypothetical protein
VGIPLCAVAELNAILLCDVPNKDELSTGPHLYFLLSQESKCRLPIRMLHSARLELVDQRASMAIPRSITVQKYRSGTKYWFTIYCLFPLSLRFWRVQYKGEVN